MNPNCNRVREFFIRPIKDSITPNAGNSINGKNKKTINELTKYSHIFDPQHKINDEVMAVKNQSTRHCCPNNFIKFRKTNSTKSKNNGTTDIKGILGSMQFFFYSSNYLYRKESIVYHCDFFRLLYIPDTHFLSLFKKSTPSFHVTQIGEVYYNGNLVGTQYAESPVIRNVTSVSPSLVNPSVVSKNTEQFEKDATLDKVKRGGKSNNIKHNVKINHKMLGNKELDLLVMKRGLNIPRNYLYLRKMVKRKIKNTFLKKWTELNGYKAIEEQEKFQTCIDRIKQIEILLKCNDNNKKKKSVNSTEEFLRRNVLETEKNDLLKVLKDNCKYIDNLGRTKRGVAKNGIYMFQILIFPDDRTIDEFKVHVNKSVQIVSEKDWYKQIDFWVNIVNNKVNINTLNGILKKEGLMYKVYEK
ncbi:Pet130p SCDLUD_004532 [Saccharomycodes ludwigii]|uniref:Pet130p n=1 Tax=Saccharomycodes ludwigii TaxID=36035 RepID=UPI001E8BBF6B|nr:hypothetical protein SCDLUD_004532 [Saccharomycodes ludwigii]KAH3899106.1 hypothetical protein SCDLUD_004532 [Saccharomycodes ludwigii]